MDLSLLGLLVPGLLACTCLYAAWVGWLIFKAWRAEKADRDAGDPDDYGADRP